MNRCPYRRKDDAPYGCGICVEHGGEVFKGDAGAIEEHIKRDHLKGRA